MNILNFRAVVCGLVAILATPFVQAATKVIDVMVVYTPAVAQAYSGNPTTRINQLLAVTNQIYSDSGVDLELHLVHSVQVNYTDDNAASTALNDITDGTGVFSGIAALRDQYKADMVIFYRPFKSVQAACGVAWIGGNKTNGVMSSGYKALMYSSLAISTCPDFVTAHELGHNMGLAHSRRQDTVGGTFHYSLGYGLDGDFTTVMAYESSFADPYGQKKILKFSSPALTCNGKPCGIVRTDTTNGADAVYTLGITVPQIAEYYPGSVTAASGSSSSSSSSGGSSSSSSGGTGYAELDTLAAAITSAQTAATSAETAYAANVAAVATKTSALSSAKATLTSATSAMKAAKASYTSAVKANTSAASKVTKAATARSTAQSKYNTAKPGAAKDAALVKLNAAIVTYNAAVTTANTAAAAVSPLQTAMDSATTTLASATSAYNIAANALKTEKASTSTLKAAVTSTKKAVTAAVKAYNTAAKRLGQPLR